MTKFAILSLIVLASPVAAQDLTGRYHFTGRDPALGCQERGMFDGTIELRKGIIDFHETTCELTNPTALRDMPEGTLYDAVCSGEGDTWTDRMMIYQTFDGVAVLSNGAARTYSRCE